MTDRPQALIAGANRGIGLGIVRELLARGWNVIATARQPDQAAALRDLSAGHPGQLDIRALDMNDPAGIDAFAAGLKGRALDLLLVNAGVSGPAHRSASAATAAETGDLMYTNAIAPIRLSRLLAGQVTAGAGVLAFTSSVMGSVALNPGGHELYRASKAALNSLTRGLWGEVKGRNITVLTLHPGWVRTDMGGAGADIDVATSITGMAAVIADARAHPSGCFVDYRGVSIDW